jgi:tetratricopeptide (TPR) repeat protein
MNRKRIVIIFICLNLLITVISGQISFMKEDPVSGFSRGMDFFQKEKYPPAIKFLDSYVKSGNSENLSRLSEAEYFSALSSLNLFSPDGEYRMMHFITTHPGSERINDAKLALGDYFYQNKSYRKASSYYNSVNRLEIPFDLLPEYCFRNGYSQFMRGDRRIALLMFSEIKDIDTDYSPPALYYFSHIAYDEKKYETAFEGFMRLKDDETFGPVVPFYIVQILYMKKDYDGILTMAPELLKSAGQQRSIELYRFIGDAYYNKGNYKEAIGYLENYTEKARATGREEQYQLAYCYYKTGEFDKAIVIFLELAARSDLMSQNVWCLLGDSYLQKGDKERAQFAFGQASLMNYDKNLKEESLFNYAKLMYETSYSPFGEVINAFQEYIDLYPGSDRIEEVYNYLVSAYTQIKNYKAAIASLDKIANKDTRLEEAYQRVAFFRGLELFLNMEIENSIDMFDKSLKYGKYSRPLRARATYWRGEAYYRLGQYDKAIEDYQDFIGIPGSASLEEYNLIRYNLGYSFFNKHDYPTALNHFRSFESSVTSVIPAILADAKNRIADCYFITTNYPLAISYYDKVIEYGKVDADYAMYQKAFAMGLTNDQQGKAAVLTSLITKFPTSKYVPGAIFERGRSYVVLKDVKRGEADFNTIISTYPNNQYVPQAIVQLGLLYFNTGDNQKAVSQFKKVIENYKSTPEARYAMTGLKNTYIEMNDVETYFAYIKTLGGYGDVNLSEKDSLLYGSGERLYMSGDCDKASEIFRNYLKEFNVGSFRLNALFYLAECLSGKGQKDEALNYYLEVTDGPNNEFMEPALQAESLIYFDREDYLKSFNCYEKLERVTVNPELIITALQGQLRSAYKAGDAGKTISVAAKINQSADMPQELSREATFMSAKAQYSLKNYDEALNNFRKVSDEITSIEGAESKYMVADLLFMEGKTDDAEKVINEFIDLNTPHQYWMAKAFILLADISIKKGDQVMARATLQGLKDNYPVSSDGIIEEVDSKLATLNAAREKQVDNTKAGNDSITISRN